MADQGGGGSRRAKDQKMAKDLVARGEFHGYRHSPTTQGINFPRLTDIGSAAHRRSGKV